MSKSSKELRKEAKKLGHKNNKVELVDLNSGETLSSSYLGGNARLKSFEKLPKKEKKIAKKIIDTGAHPGNEDRRTARKEYFHLEESELQDINEAQTPESGEYGKKAAKFIAMGRKSNEHFEKMKNRGIGDPIETAKAMHANRQLHNSAVTIGAENIVKGKQTLGKEVTNNDAKNIFKNTEMKTFRESEFSDDLKNIYGIGKSDDDLRQKQEDKLRDLLDEIKDIRYGFKDKVTGEVYDNREWIHNCKDLSRYYEVQKDPRITLKDKLGICTDQCLAIEYLMRQKYQDIKPCLYALMKGRFGHCTLGFNDGDNKYYYLENAWDKMKKDDKPTLYGPFESEDKLKDFFKDIYFKAHEKDNDDPVEVMRYNEYLQEYGLNESVDIRKFK